MHPMESVEPQKGRSFGHCDPEHLIRSAQRAEGNPDCFRTGKKECDQLVCLWRMYCMERDAGS